MAVEILFSYNSTFEPGTVVELRFDPETKSVTTPYASPGSATQAEPTQGDYVYQECDGTTLDRIRYDGNDLFAYDPQENSPTCNYTPPADGTFLRNDCNGFNLQKVLADGEGGERWGDVVEANSTQCGYEPPEEPILGCMDPDADNYDPLATEDNGTCTYPAPTYHAVGGVLPNPINYVITADPLLEGEPKRNHFIKASIYRADYTLIGTMQARVRNGKATLDVSGYLRPVVGTEITTATENVEAAENAMLGFYIGYTEHYNGIATTPKMLKNPKRYAVEAALDGYADDMRPYLLDYPAPDTLPAFTTPYAQPVAFSGLPFEVSILISEAMADKPMWFERRYLDHAGNELEILSTAIPSGMAGKRARLRLDAMPLHCAWKVELCINDENRAYFGSCPVAEGIRIFDKTFDFTFE